MTIRMIVPLLIFGMLGLAISSSANKDFLSPQEIDSIRDEQDYGKRVLLYLEFAQRRLDTVREKLRSKDPQAGEAVQNNLSEYNSILQALGDSLDAAREQRASLNKPLKQMETQGTAFLRYLESLQTSSVPSLADFKFTLDEAIDTTQDELADVKKGAFPEVRQRKPPSDLPASPPPPAKGNSQEGPPRKKSSDSKNQ